MDYNIAQLYIRALALNCNTSFTKEGAEAQDWKKGKPLRVVRQKLKVIKHVINYIFSFLGSWP